MTGDKGGTIVVYVGRGNLKQRLTAHIDGSDADHFYFRELRTDLDAYREECRLFHSYGEDAHLDNENHPAKPAGSAVACTTCMN